MVYYGIWNYNCHLCCCAHYANWYQSSSSDSHFFIAKCDWYDAVWSNLVGITGV